MNELRVKLPTRLVNQLRIREIDERKIQSAVIAALWQLTFERPKPQQRSGESFSDYLVRAAQEARENAPFIGDMTWKEWIALTDAEQEALWNTWHEQAGDDLDEIGWNAQARLTDTARQKRRAKIPARVREKKTAYRTGRRRTKINY
ncbi:MAG: hypothetical protein HY741_07655 [Chloroflexi bacterium]|nr:hypothetical protein [Chloroflexota bacterium]